MLDQISSLDVARDLAIKIDRELPADWPSVVDTSRAKCHIFQTREFLESWLATAGVQLRAQVYFVEVSNRTGSRVLLLPLSIIRRRGETTLSFVDAELSDYNVPVLYPTDIVWTHESARTLWDAIVARLPKVDRIVLDKLVDGVGGLVNPLHLIADEPNDEGAHGLDLTVPWEEIETRFKRIRKRLRTIEKLGKVELIVAKTQEQRRRILDRAIAQKQRRFDETQVVGFEYFPERLAYFRKATDVFAGAGALQLCAMTVDDEIVATSWTLGMGTHAYEIMIGFEAGQWAKHSCGRILILMHINWLIDNGFTYLDHGIGDEEWKLSASNRHLQLRKLVEAVSVRGRAMAALRGAKQVIRTNPVWKALRPIKFALEKRFAPRISPDQ